jgi:hypothetical protein
LKYHNPSQSKHESGKMDPTGTIPLDSTNESSTRNDSPRSTHVIQKLVQTFGWSFKLK